MYNIVLHEVRVQVSDEWVRPDPKTLSVLFKTVRVVAAP